MKKRTILLLLLALALVFTACVVDDGGESAVVEEEVVQLDPLPAPRLEGNDFAFANATITSDNLDQYLDRSDTIYLDVRETAEYEEGHLEGFVNLPYWGYLLPKEEGVAPQPLYAGTKEEPIAVYEESDAVLGQIVEQFEGKNVFVMCKTGGRAAWIMQILEAKGHDTSNFYNIGGWSHYEEKENYVKEAGAGTSLLNGLPALDTLTLIVQDNAA